MLNVSNKTSLEEVSSAIFIFIFIII